MSRRITDVANETEKDPWFPPLGVVWLQPASAVRPTHGGEPGEWTMNGGEWIRRGGTGVGKRCLLQCFSASLATTGMASASAPNDLSHSIP